MLTGLLLLLALGPEGGAPPAQPNNGHRSMREAYAAYEQGDFTRASTGYSEALLELRREFPPSHPSVTACLHNLGVMARHGKKYAASLSYLDQAISLRGRDPAHAAQLAASLSEKAATLAAMRDPYSAEPLLRQAIAILHANDARDSPQLVNATNTLGALYLTLQDPEGAEKQFHRALEIQKRTGRLGDLQTARVHANLATALFAQGRQDDGLALYKDSIERQKTLAGPNHHSLLVSLRSYALLLDKAKQRDASREIRRQADVLVAAK